MSCERPCQYREIVEQTTARIDELIEKDHHLVEEDVDAQQRGWESLEHARKQDIQSLNSAAEVDGLLCSDEVCNLAYESVKARVASMCMDQAFLGRFR